MGFSYTYGPRPKLCCDRCGNHPARKHKCPAGYCPTYALCKACNKEVKANGTWEAAHCNCAKHAAAFKAIQDETSRRLAAGEFLRYSALNAGRAGVHVLFHDSELAIPKRKVVGFYMSSTTYSAIPLGVPAGVDDYRKFGPLEPAPSEFEYGHTTKQVEVEAILA